MKVLMVGVSKERYGGMWTVAENYINDKLYNQKVKLDYIATSTNGSIIKRILFMIKGLITAYKKIKKNKYDIVHLHMAEKGSVFRKGMVAKIAKKNNTKVVIQMHAGPFMEWYKTLNNKKQKKIIRIFKNSDKLLVLGEYWKKEMIKIVPKNKISVLYNGIKTLEKNLYNINSKNIIYMGVLKKEKGIYDLIEAINLINDKLEKNIKVQLCGNDLEGNIPEFIKQKKLEERIKVLGWIEKEQKEKILKNAMINVLPSYFEALSMTIIEAMSYGIPIITTDISTMREILGDDALLIKPGDINSLANNILMLVNNTAKREEMSEKEYIQVKKNFDLKINIENTIKIYNEIIEGDKN